MTDHKGSHDRRKLSRDPRTSDEPLAGLLATEPAATPATLGKPSKRSQRNRRMPIVELLYFSGCPNHQRALAVLQEVIRTAKLHASIELVAVETQEDAERQQFYGSPTIRVNGIDILPPDPSAQPALACRVYRTALGALTPIPPAEVIAAALQRR
jgi:hypothetical protein